VFFSSDNKLATLLEVEARNMQCRLFSCDEFLLSGLGKLNWCCAQIFSDSLLTHLTI
jgi:hypothetical protein